MKVTVIIVNWNTGRLLKECLESLAALPEKDKVAEIIVLDNASHDSSFEQAKAVECGVPTTLMGLPKNLGFAAANNMGIRRRRTKESHVLLLNPDTQVLPGALLAGLQEFEANPRTGVVGVRLLNTDRSTQPSVRALPSFMNLLWLFLKLNRLFPQAYSWLAYIQAGFDYNQRQVVEQVMGAVFFIRHDVIAKVGLLDESFWVWFEEVDYCERVQTAEWDVVYTPTGEVIHHQAASFNQLIGWQKTLPFLRSALRYAYKHLSIIEATILAILWPVSLALALPASLRHTVLREQNKTRL